MAFRFLLWLEEKAEAGCPAPLFTPNRKHDPETSISIRVRPAPFAADIHITGIFIHIAGIRIHIRPESLFTSLRNPYSHRPEYARDIPRPCSQSPRNPDPARWLPIRSTDDPSQSLRTKDEFHLSPDGRLIAYDELREGRWDVFVASFPAFQDIKQVSPVGGVQPGWLGDGRELFYISTDGEMMSVTLERGSPVKIGAPRKLFDATRALSLIAKN